MPARRPTSLAALAAALFTALLAGPATPAASAAACKGRDLVRNAAIKVVHRPDRLPGGRRGHRYVACVDAEYHEPVRIRGSRRGARLEFLGSAGGFLAVREPATGAVHLWNAADGGVPRRVRSAGRDPLGHVVVAGAGEAAAVFPHPAGARVVGYDYDGRAYTLDTGAIAAGSLRRGDGAGISWENAGLPRTADLSQPALPCASLGGKRVRGGGGVLRIVSFEFTDEYWLGQLTGSTTRIRACALPDGPVRVVGENRQAPSSVVGEPFEIVGVHGTSIVVHSSSWDSSGDGDEEYVLHDIATGRRTLLLSGTDSDGPMLTVGPLVAPTGEAAVLSLDFPGETLRAFDASGRSHVLDSAASDSAIDDKSIRLDGTVLSWTRDGERRSADLAALPAPLPG